MIRHQRWDYGWNKIGRNLCGYAIKHLKLLMRKKYKPQCSGNKTLCLYRDNVKGNLKKMFGKKSFGAGKRKYKDMNKIHKIFNDTKYTNTDGMPILKQISYYVGHNKIILEHGAGMVFTLFMNPGSKIIEIIPPKKLKHYRDGAVQGLPRISKSRGYKLQRVVLNNNQSILRKKRHLQLLNKKFLKIRKKVQNNCPKTKLTSVSGDFSFCSLDR